MLQLGTSGAAETAIQRFSPTPLAVQDAAMLDRKDAKLQGTSIGSISWEDMFILRAGRASIARYNAAQPLPVIAGVSEAERSTLEHGPASGRPVHRTHERYSRAWDESGQGR